MRAIAIAVIVVFIGVIISCKKTPLLQSESEAQWIKVVSDSPATFPGKIRADAQNNLFCSYNYTQPEISGSSAILKLNSNGDLLWRKQFDSLPIFDFLVDQEGVVIIASASGIQVNVIEISTMGDDTNLIGSYELPSFGKPVTKVLGIKILKDTIGGGYNLSGTVKLGSTATVNTAGFMLAMSVTGTGLWKQSYVFEKAAGAATAITGCIQMPDGFMLFGNLQFSSPAISKFFILKCDLNNGDTLWSRFYNTSSYDPDSESYHGYYCSTSDIVSGDDGYFYGGAFNVLYNTPAQFPFPINTDDDNSARIFKISATGDTIKSIRVKFAVQNGIADLVKKKGGGLLVGLNPYKLGNFAFVGKRNSFIANISPSFTLQSVSTTQTQYSDYLGSVCAMPDGHYAIEKVIQSLGQTVNHLEIIKTDENGNF